MPDNNYLFMVKILFKLDWAIDEQALKCSVDNRIKMMMDDIDERQEASASSYRMDILSHPNSKMKEGQIDIYVNGDLEKASLVAASVESISNIFGNKVEFALNNIEDVFSARVKVNQRAMAILDSYKQSSKEVSTVPIPQQNRILSIANKISIKKPHFEAPLKSRKIAFSTYPVIMAFIMLVVAGVFTLQKSISDANTVANYAYVFLAIGAIWKFIDYLREKRNQSPDELLTRQ